MNELKSLTLNGKKYDSFPDQTARENGGGSVEGAVLYTEQALTDEQKARARENIDAVDETKVETIVNNALGKADLSEYQLVGQTPQYLSGKDATYDIVIEANEETNVSVISDTVAEMAGAINVNYLSCEETVENGVHTLECKSTGVWHSIHKDFTITGLEAGKTYTVMYDARGVVRSSMVESGIYATIVLKTTGNVTVAQCQLYAQTELTSFEFTATGTSVVVQIYPVASSITTADGIVIRYRDLWINRSLAKAERTAVYRFDAIVSDRTDLKGVKGGVTVESTPAANVYVKVVDGEEPTGYLKGKKCVCFGDSITGHYTSPSDYPTFIANKTGMEVINGGFGGCRMAEHPSDAYSAFSMYSLADSVASGDWSVQDAAIESVTSPNASKNLEALKAVDWSTVDYITIFYGTNDFMGGVALDNDNDPLSTSQFKSALRYSIETILTAYPRIRIAVVTPMYRYWTEDGTITDSDVRESNGLKLTDFVEAAIEVANEYKIPAFDIYHQLGVNKINRATFLSDGTHPSDYGRERIGEYLAAKLISM